MTTEEQRSMQLIDYFLQNSEVLGQLSETDCKDILRLSSSIAAATEDSSVKGKCLDLLYACCFHMDLDIKELWNIYWIINYTLFSNSSISFSGHRDELYRFIFLKIKNSLSDTYAPYAAIGSNLVIMTTSQYLSADHAPTRRLLDYAHAIHTALGKKVMIVNDAGLNYYPCRCLFNYQRHNFVQDFCHLDTIEYNGISFSFLQLDGKMPDLYCLKETLDYIYSLQPELVYNIGGSSLLSDLCSTFTKTCCFPCSTDIPVTMSQYLLVGRSLEPSDAERLSRLEAYQQTIETVVNYQLPEEAGNPYKREDFSLSDSNFVFGIMGNRLDIEIGDSFINLIEQLLLKTNAHFLIIGKTNMPERILNKVSQPERVHVTGPLKKGYLALQLFDVYLNPYRKGGGRSSFEALISEIPVITFPYGDVYHTCGREFAVQDEAAYLETAVRYQTDKDYLEKQKLCGKKRAETLSNIAETQKEVLDKILL